MCKNLHHSLGLALLLSSAVVPTALHAEGLSVVASVFERTTAGTHEGIVESDLADFSEGNFKSRFALDQDDFLFQTGALTPEMNYYGIRYIPMSEGESEEDGKISSIGIYNLLDGSETILKATSPVAATDMTYDWATGTLFAVEGKAIYTIDQKTGDSKTYASFTSSVFGIAADGNGLIYAIGRDGEGGSAVNKLYTLNTQSRTLTAKATLSGFDFLADQPISIEFAPDGTLYLAGKIAYLAENGLTYNNNVIGVINTQTGILNIVNNGLNHTLTGLSFIEKDPSHTDYQFPEEAVEDPVRVKEVHFFGDLNTGRMNTSVVTSIKRYYYDNNNRLVRIAEANVMQADDETTRLVETEGMEVNKYYRTYNYTERGWLQNISSRQNALLSDYDLIWGDAQVEEKYSYDGIGRTTAKSTTSAKISYIWEGQNMVKEISKNTSGNWNSTTIYFDFVAPNKPTKALLANPQVESYGKVYNYDRLITYTYNDKGLIAEQNEYELSSSTQDASNDNAISDYVAKENIATQIVYTYNADGKLLEQVTSQWNNGKKELVPNIKVSNTYEEDGTIWTQTLVHSSTTGNWANYGTPSRTYNVTVDKATAPNNIYVKLDKDRENCLIITATTPEKKTDAPYSVFRNGVKIGEATVNGNSLSYTDELVPNGTWEYFMAQGDGCISDIVSYTFATELAAPRQLRVVENGNNGNDQYQVLLAWKAPQSTLTLLGYNVYDNVNANATRPTPVNEKVFVTANNYTLVYDIENATLEHTYYVEAVYAIGKQKGETLAVTLSKEMLEVKEDKSISATKTVYNLGNASNFTFEEGATWDYSAAQEKTINFYNPDNVLSRSARYIRDGQTWNVAEYTIYRHEEGNEGETHIDVDGNVLYNIYWHSYNENGDVTSAFLNGATPESHRLIDYTYDEQGRLVGRVARELTNTQTDERGVVVGEAGSALTTESWFYHDTIVGNVITYTKTGVSVEDVLAKEAHYYTTVTFDGDAATGLVRTAAEKSYHVALAAVAPELSDASTWYVYRNGQNIGLASIDDDNNLTFKDENLPTGIWDYFIQCVDLVETEGVNISNALTIEISLNFAAPAKIYELHNGINAKGLHEVKIAWETPNTDLDIEGYNVYLDGSNAPINKNPLVRKNFTRTWPVGSEVNHSVRIEALYNGGKATSEAYNFTLSSEKLPQEISKTFLKILDGTMGDIQDESIRGVSKATKYYYDVNNNVVSALYYQTIGEEVPTYLYVYDYNEVGQLTKVQRRQYGIYDGYDYCWNEGIEESSYSYDKNGKVEVETTANSTIRYTYEGNNVVRTLTHSNLGNLLSAVVYYDFLENGDNLPQYAVSNGMFASAQRIYEYTYDEESLNLLATYSYKIVTGSAQSEGEYWLSAEKGTPDLEELYTYDENDQLILYVKNRWNTSAGKYLPYMKTVYTQIEGGTKAQTYSTMDKGASWQVAATSTFHNTIEYKGSAPTNLTRVIEEGAPANHVSLCADAPADVTAETVYNVFCNGICIGKTSDIRDGKIYYTDKNAKIGEWHYFMQDAKADSCDHGVFSSNCINVNISIDLPAVDSFREVVNGLDANAGGFVYTFEWDAPQSEYEILGYHIFVDIPSTTNHPAPNTLTPITETTYSLNWDTDTNLKHTIYIQTVYNCGKVNGKKNTITLDKTTGIEAAGIAENKLVVMNNRLFVRGAYESVEVFAANGAKAGEWSQTEDIDLSHLHNGTYVVRLRTNDHVIVEKINIR